MGDAYEDAYFDGPQPRDEDEDLLRSVSAVHPHRRAIERAIDLRRWLLDAAEAMRRRSIDAEALARDVERLFAAHGGSELRAPSLADARMLILTVLERFRVAKDTDVLWLDHEFEKVLRDYPEIRKRLTFDRTKTLVARWAEVADLAESPGKKGSPKRIQAWEELSRALARTISATEKPLKPISLQKLWFAYRRDRAPEDIRRAQRRATVNYTLSEPDEVEDIDVPF